MKIPKSFKLFATTYNVIWDNERMNDKSLYGLCDYSTCTISLAKTYNMDELSQDRILDTYYHEKVHAILNAMDESDLCSNEKFVDVFAKLLRQSDETSDGTIEDRD